MHTAHDQAHDFSPIPMAHRGRCGCNLCSATRVASAREKLANGHYDSPAVIDQATQNLLAQMLPGEPAPAYLAGALAATA